MTPSVQLYNFNRSDRISKNQLRSLRFVHDRFARNISSAISAFLRKVVEINLDNIDQVSYSEFLAAASDPTCYSAISLKPLEGSAALEIAPEAIFTILDRLLGGTGQPLDMERPTMISRLSNTCSDMTESSAPDIRTISLNDMVSPVLSALVLWERPVRPWPPR